MNSRLDLSAVSGRESRRPAISLKVRRTVALSLASLGAVIVAAVAVIYWPSSPTSPVPRPLLVNAVLFAVAGALIMLDTGGARNRWTLWTPWVAWGGLLAAAAVAPLFLAPWLLAAMLAFALASIVLDLRGWPGLSRRFLVVVTVALFDFALLWPAAVGAPRQASRQEFRGLDLRVHSFLSDVPLHDVWVFHLPDGGEGRTLEDVHATYTSRSSLDMNTVVAGFVWVRWAAGAVLGWDTDRDFADTASYVTRLTEEDRARSLEQPGTRHGSFRVVYSFRNETLAEIMNATGHSFFCAAMVPVEDGYRMYWAIYVKETSWFTPVYMRIIEPFREHLVYPALIRNIERAWTERWNVRPADGGE